MKTSTPHPRHKIYPYLLRHLTIERPNQVWCADITYIPMRRGFLYLVAIMDWASRKVLAWRLSNTMEADFCVAALGGCHRPIRVTRHLQYRSGFAVHQLRLHQHAQGRRHPHLHGRTRPLDGQRVHRTAVAVAEVRVRVPSTPSRRAARPVHAATRPPEKCGRRSLPYLQRQAEEAYSSESQKSQLCMWDNSRVDPGFGSSNNW